MAFERIINKLPKEVLALFTDTATLFMIRVVAALLAYFTQVILARWMGASELGIFVYTMSWLWILGLIATLGLGSAANRFLPEYETTRQTGAAKGYISMGRTISFGAGMAFGIGAILLGFIFTKFSLSEHMPYVLAAAALPFLALTSFNSGVARAHLWFRFASISGVLLRPLLLLVSISLAMWLSLPASATLVTAMLCVIIIGISLGQYLFIERRLHAKFADARTSKHTKLWLSVALPIVVADLFMSFFIDVNIIVSGFFLSDADIAIFNAALRTVAIIAFAINAAGFVTAPRAAKLFAQGDQQGLQRLITQASHIMFWPALCAWLMLVVFGKYLLLLFGENFVVAYATMLLIAGSQTVIAAAGPLLPLLNVTGQQKRALPVFALSLFAIPLIYWLLMPRFGLFGGAMAYFIVSLFSALWLRRIIITHIGIHPGIIYRNKPSV